MNKFLISAAHKSSGKTTVSIGLCAALTEQGKRVQPFKKGPDYIDPMWLGMASGRPCYNLDFYLCSNEEIKQDFAHRASDCDTAIVEANMGLFDGMSLDCSDSNAALAKLLGLPVILVVDTRGMFRGIAPLLKGYADFDKNLNIAGVILNQVGGSRHEAKLRASVEHYTDIPVLGAIHRNPDLSIEERHLGLIPSNEIENSRRLITACRDAVTNSVDVHRIHALDSEPLAIEPATQSSTPKTTDKLRIGIAMDAAFGFYYPGDLEIMKSLSVEIVPINMLQDTRLPEIDGLFIGGGFPETHMKELEANSTMRESVRTAIENGLPTYAECGGMMYLSRSIHWGDQSANMVGIIPGVTRMHERPKGRGYTRLQETSSHPWTRLDENQGEFTFPAHEFHHSSLDIEQNNPTYAYKVLRGTGINGENDGYIHKNLLANYVHLRNVVGNQWVSRFIQFVRDHNTRPNEH
jgi:cobyrinic acid a,c-diamide synthase